jgi:hypothetical protein
MRVVVCGSHSISEMEVEPLLLKLLAMLTDKYPRLRIIAMDCDRGVGKLIKNTCLPPEEKRGKPKFCLEELALRIYSAGPELTSVERAALLKPRNAYLVEVGEEFHIFFGAEGMHGMMGDLYERLKEHHARVASYQPGDRELKEPQELA